MELHNLFIQPVAKFILNQDLNKLYNFSLILKNSRVISNIGGFQSEGLDFKKIKILNNFSKELFTKINDFSKILSIEEELVIKHLWININNYRDFNLLHRHSNNLISGVFYINAPKNSGNIVFHNSEEDHMYVVRNIKKYNSYNSTTWWFKPENNLLLLFPSWLKHRVEPNMSNEKRISISFNIGYK